MDENRFSPHPSCRRQLHRCVMAQRALSALLAAALLAATRAERDGTTSTRGCAVSLDVAARVATAGCAGFEAFEVDGGAPLLAAANFWDGRSQDMSAESVVFRVTPRKNFTSSANYRTSKKRPGKTQLHLERVQAMRTQGAHGWDYFESTAGDKLLVMPNYYGCGSDRGPTHPDAACRSTAVYRWSERATEFREIQRLATSGPGQTDHFERGGRTYLVVGENFADQVAIFVWDTAGRVGQEGAQGEGRFRRVQTLPCPGAGATAVAEIGGDVWLVAASYHDSGWSTRSPVYVWAGGGGGGRG